MKINDFEIALVSAPVLSVAATGFCQDSADEYLRLGKELFEKQCLAETDERKAAAAGLPRMN